MREHARHVDSKILNVTKFKIQTFLTHAMYGRKEVARVWVRAPGMPNHCDVETLYT